MLIVHIHTSCDRSSPSLYFLKAVLVNGPLPLRLLKRKYPANATTIATAAKVPITAPATLPPSCLVLFDCGWTVLMGGFAFATSAESVPGEAVAGEAGSVPGGAVAGIAGLGTGGTSAIGAGKGAGMLISSGPGMGAGNGAGI